MRVLITTKNSPIKGYLIKLFCERSIAEVRELIMNEKRQEAIMLTFRNGAFEQEVSEREIPQVHANLILSESNAMWDLT